MFIKSQGWIVSIATLNSHPLSVLVSIYLYKDEPYVELSNFICVHSRLLFSDKIKPCISHRDLNSRNILVKQDLSCCLCDLGFAMKTSGSKYYHNGEEQHAETKSINEVGTRRYMAPEVLEGAVNLRDCETSLKQIDVYSLGLVLWELATRCTDFYQIQELPQYKLPFQAEIGLHPTLEQMQALVCRRKARPLFPAQWRDTAAGRLVRDTVEDCWDQDAEARLTALCVEERLSELPPLRDRHCRGVFAGSPTAPSVNNNHLPFLQNHVEHEINVTSGGQSHAPPGKDMYDVSEGTVETLLTMSPTEHPQELNCKFIFALHYPNSFVSKNLWLLLWAQFLQ